MYKCAGMFLENCILNILNKQKSKDLCLDIRGATFNDKWNVKPKNDKLKLTKVNKTADVTLYIRECLEAEFASLAS